jgi:hypothetical protein
MTSPKWRGVCKCKQLRCQAARLFRMLSGKEAELQRPSTLQSIWPPASPEPNRPVEINSELLFSIHSWGLPPKQWPPWLVQDATDREPKTWGYSARAQIEGDHLVGKHLCPCLLRPGGICIWVHPCSCKCKKSYFYNCLSTVRVNTLSWAETDFRIHQTARDSQVQATSIMQRWKEKRNQ